MWMYEGIHKRVLQELELALNAVSRILGIAFIKATRYINIILASYTGDCEAFVKSFNIHGFSKLMPEGIRVKSHLWYKNKLEKR